MSSWISRIPNSPSLWYVFLRYITYAIQFINSILLANYLGVYGFGIYGFILLLQQYLSYTNLGINESLNTDFALKKHSRFLPPLIWDCAWSINLLLILLVFLAGIVLLVCWPGMFQKYEYSSYALLLLGANAFMNANKLYITFYKLYGRMQKINFQQFMPNALLLLLTLIYKERITVVTIVWALLIGNIIPFIWFRIGLPLRFHFRLHRIITLRLLKRGVSLLLYNLSFYFILVAASSIVSIFYTVEELGAYSFSNTLSNAVIMAGGAFLFIFYPKMIYKLGLKDKAEVQAFLKRIRYIYILCIDLVALLSVLLIPFLVYIAPDYETTVNIFKILIIARIIMNATSGYATLLVATRQEPVLIVYGILAIAIIIVSGCCIGFLHLGIENIAWSVVIASLCYTYLVVRKGILHFSPASVYGILKEIFDKGNLLALFCICLSILINNAFVIPFIGILLFLYLNKTRLKETFLSVMEIIRNKNSLNF